MIQKSSCFILVIIICFCLTGCNNTYNNNKNQNLDSITMEPNSTTVETKENEDTTVNVIDTSNEVDVTETVPTIEAVDYSDCFIGIEGCAVFFNSDTNVYHMFKEKLCKKRISPCSTFKIVATLMGLENGVINSVDSKMGYNETIYSMDAWNKDLSLKEAFNESCVWYFRKVMDQIGQSEVQTYVNQLGYGNCDISEWEGSGINPLPELNGFWLESSLKISPKEQVDILANIFNGNTYFSQQNIDILKEVMLSQKDGTVSVYGKTGTGRNAATGNGDNGWFVGMFENSDKTYYFVVHLSDQNKEVSGKLAKETALNIINRYYVKE